jgi:hypothetical protein
MVKSAVVKEKGIFQKLLKFTVPKSIPLTGTIPLSYHWWFHPNHRYVDIPKRTWFQMVWLLISLYIQLLSTMNNFPYRQWVQTGAYNYNLNLFLNKFLNDNEYIIYVHCPRIWNLFVPALESGGKVSLCVQTPPLMHIYMPAHFLICYRYFNKVAELSEFLLAILLIKYTGTLRCAYVQWRLIDKYTT